MKNFDNYYHLIARSNQEQRLFGKPADYRFYLRILKEYKHRLRIQIYGFCLMPDYVSLLVRCRARGELALFTQTLRSSYARYFKARYQRTGVVWRKRLKTTILEENEITDCLKDMEMFPVRSHITETLSEYPWSSFLQRVLGKGHGLLDF